MDEYGGDDESALMAAVERAEGSRSTTSGQPSGSKVVQPKPQALPQRQGPSAILVSTRQKGNPILNYVKSLPWEYSEIVCDYVLGKTTCALFLSLKYHRLHPEYIYSRIRALGKSYNLRILLTMVDIQNHEEALKELSKTSMINNLTLILCWSAQEAGRYLELFKSYEHASSASIRAHQATTYQESLTEFVTTPRNINKTDAASLISNFGSLRAAVNAQPEELAMVPGWGEKKVKAWYGTLREPFRVKRAAKANATLLRQESSLASRAGVTNVTPEPPSLKAIPISSVPSREATRSSISRENTRPENSLGRSKMSEVEPDDVDATEELRLPVAVDAETMVSEAEALKPVEKVIREEPRLTDGVAAALAKLRQNG